MRTPIGYKFILGFIVVVAVAAFVPNFVERADVAEWLRQPLSFLIAILIGLILGSILTRGLTKRFNLRKRQLWMYFLKKDSVHYLFLTFSQSSKNLFIPMSVNSCLNMSLRIEYGTVATCAPILPDFTTCSRFLMLATITWVL